MKSAQSPVLMKIVRVLLACLKAEAYPYAGEALCRRSLRLPSGERIRELCVFGGGLHPDAMTELSALMHAADCREGRCQRACRVGRTRARAGGDIHWFGAVQGLSPPACDGADDEGHAVLLGCMQDEFFQRYVTNGGSSVVPVTRVCAA